MCHDTFAEETAHLGAADIKDIAELSQLGQRDVAGIAGKAVTETGTIDEEGNLCLLTDGMELLQFLTSVEGAVFCGIADVKHPRSHHVLISLVGIELTDVGLNFGRRNLAVVSRKGEYLMATRLDGTRLVDVDVCGLGSQYAFVMREEGIDDGGVGLGASDEEVDVETIIGTSLTHKLLSLGCNGILTVAYGLLEVGIDQPLEYLRVATLHVIGIEVEHSE